MADRMMTSLTTSRDL